MPETTLLHRVSAPTSGVTALLHRASAPSVGRRALMHRASNTSGRAALLHRASAPTNGATTLLHRVISDGPLFTAESPPPASYPETCLPTRAVGLSEWDAAWKLGVSGLQMDIRGGEDAGVDLSGIPYKLEVQHQRSASSTWSLSIQDDTGAYHPHKVGGDWEGVLGMTVAHRMKATVKHGGKTFSYTGPATGFSHQRAARDGGWFKDAVWSGIDESKALFARSVTMASVRSTRTRIQYSAPVVKEILQAAGLKGPSGFQNFPIRLFHRQDGRYGDWLMRLLEVNGQQWRMKGKTFFCYDALAGHGRLYTYSSDTIVFNESFNSSFADVLTRVTVKRLVERDDEAGTDPEVATTFGKYSKTFDRPISAVQWQTPVQSGGIFSDFIFRNEAGNVISVRNIRGGVWPLLVAGAPIYMAKSVEYTWGAQPGVLATEGYGEILFTGTAGDLVDDEDFPDAFNAALTVEVVDADLETLFGQVREEMEVNELVATPVQATSFGRGHLNKLKAALSPLSITCPLNPDLVDGSRVRIVDDVLGLSIERVVLSASHTFTDDPLGRQTTFTCGGYL